MVPGCSTAPSPRPTPAAAAIAVAVASPWPEADALFRRDARWLGGDAIYSVDLGHDRLLWLFGDSFVATDQGGDRRRATMVRNTLAVQQGRDPATATITFHWGRGPTGTPRAFFADAGEVGFWPLHGVREPDGALLLFQTRVRSTPGHGLGFAIEGWRLLRIDDPDADPATWRPVEVVVDGLPPQVTFGTATWLDGERLVALGTLGNGPHRGVLARLRLGDVGAERATGELWLGTAWGTADTVPAAAIVLDDAGPECSLHDTDDGYVHVRSRGFGATTLVMQRAKSPTGPWSAPQTLFTPPESRGERPFVYAGKAHPGLAAGAGWLAVSYATNSFTFADLFVDAGQRSLYWPRFWRVPAR